MVHSRLQSELAAASAPAALLSPGVWAKNFTLTDDFIGFEGHFPGHPIVPAMVQILMARMLIEEIGGESLSTVQSAKFLAPIPPRTSVVVTARQKGYAWQIDIAEQTDDDRQQTVFAHITAA